MPSTDGQQAGPPDHYDIRRSSRDPAALAPRLEAWLATRLPPASEPAVSGVEGSSATGMSSETLLFDAAWSDDVGPRRETLVARVAPDPADVPVFPSYDLGSQYEAIRLVGELSKVPVPRVWWWEPEPAAIGAPFFVMSRVEGQVPPDVMPYTFGDNWLYDAARADQERLQERTVAVLAELHGIARPESRFSFLAYDEPGDSALRRHVEHARRWYEFVAADVGPSTLIERGFAWLEDHWPADDGETVLSWGDSRIGNVMYRDFEPAAVLDWEMAALGPRELDVAWLVYSHRAFEDLAAGFELPGMPHFLRREDVVAAYEALSGTRLGDLDFFLTYAALRWAIVFVRTGTRQVHFGEQAMPADVDDFLHNRDPFERMLAGHYWD